MRESVPEYADEVYGLAWRQVFKLRNTVALRYCERYGRRIPAEEFLSGANEAIVEALSSFDATRGAAFASHLWLVLSRKMRAVVEQEWRGHIRRSYSGSTRQTHRRLSQTYTPPEFVEVMPETLSVPCHAEHAVLLREVLTYLATQERATMPALSWAVRSARPRPPCSRCLVCASTPLWVSGSSETKTYGKSAAVRAHEKQQTLPRRSFFGKDTTERLHIFNVLQTRFSPTEALFSGKLSYTDIARGCRASL